MENRVRQLQENGSMLSVGVPLRCTVANYHGISDIETRGSAIKLFHPINDSEHVWNYEMPPYVVGLWLMSGNQEGTSVTIKEQIPASILQDFLVDTGKVFSFTRTKNYFTFTLANGNNLAQNLTALGLNNGIRLNGILLSSSFRARMEILAAIVDSRATCRNFGSGYGYSITANQHIVDIVITLAQSLGIECRNPYRYYPAGPDVDPQLVIGIHGEAINEISIENLPFLNHGRMVPSGIQLLAPEYKRFGIGEVNRREIVHGFRLADDNFAMLSSFTLCSPY
ncbi:unnamed protein product [Cunninghamella blakesleeana]